jgi:hypothetical protein
MWIDGRLSFEPGSSAQPYDRQMSPQPMNIVAQAEDRVFSAGMPHQDVDCARPALTFPYECVVSALATEAPVRHPNAYHQLSSRGSRSAPPAKRTAVPCASQGGGIWTEMKSAGATRWAMAHRRCRTVARPRSTRMIVSSIISRLRPCCCSLSSSYGLLCAPATPPETRHSQHRAVARPIRSATAREQ